MNTHRSISFIVVLLLGLHTASCDKNPSGSEEESEELSIALASPSDSQVYWTDRPIPCSVTITPTEYTSESEVTWIIGGKVVECTNGELPIQPDEGEYEVTVEVQYEGQTKTETASITILEGFSVLLITPEEDGIYYNDEEIPCSAEVTPEKYNDKLVWWVNDQVMDCTDSFEPMEAGEYSIVSEVTFQGRTETDVVRTEVLPVITGKVYPFTSNGVVSTSNLQVTLTTKNKSSSDVNTEANVASNGNFTIRTEAVKDFESNTDVRLYVSGNGDFYSSVAELSGTDLLDLVENGELSFILPPKRWTIPSGKLQGQSTNINLLDAFESGASDFQFYDPLITILKHNRPIKTAISREYYKDITPQDSVNLWKNKLRLLEEYLGLGELFTPADESEVPTTQDGFLISFDNPDRIGSAANFTTKNGSIIGGWIEFSHIEHVESKSVHEPIHMIGFGHTCKWNSTMTNGCMSTSLYPVVKDVSYMQLAYLVRDFQYERNVPFGLEDAYASIKE